MKLKNKIKKRLDSESGLCAVQKKEKKKVSKSEVAHTVCPGESGTPRGGKKGWQIFFVSFSFEVATFHSLSRLYILLSDGRF